MAHWTWAVASSRGVSHQRDNSRRQDAYQCITAGPDSSFLIAIACDGAGSAAMGGEGASLTARTIASAARQYLGQGGELPNEATVWTWVDAARDRIEQAAALRGAQVKDFATTLVCAISNGEQTLCAHIGDGAAVVRTAEGQWQALSWPAQGEYASTTYFVTDDPSPQLRLTTFEEPVDAISCFTDGIERLALDFTSMLPHEPFFNGMIRPVGASLGPGLDIDLSRKLQAYLDSEPVNLRTDDDKTLILAVRK